MANKSGKALIKSKTFWFNILAVIILIANFFGFQDFELNPAIDGVILSLVPIVNIVLRYVTKEKITSIR